MDVLDQDRREGLGRRSESRISLLLLILVSLILLLSSLYSAEASVFRKARETVMDVASPVLAIFSGPIAAIQDGLGQLNDYFAVLEQNKALREENAQLRQWMVEARELRSTIANFKALNAYHAPPDALPINGFVIGDTNDAYTHSMIVNAGSNAGARRGQAVVDDFGLVGRVVDVSGGASRVLLLTDVQSRVPVYVDGVFVEGILAGRSDGRPAISFTIEGDFSGLEEGMDVLTSGAGGSLPRGLPVGTLSRISANEAVVDLHANYARTRMVRIINYQFPYLAPGANDVEEAEPEPESGPESRPEVGADAAGAEGVVPTEGQ